jgi:protein arginine N-methyltransferase 3
MATEARELPPKQELLRDDGEDYEDDGEEEEGEEGWDDWESDGEGGGGGLLCLFCSSRFDSEGSLFAHCGSEHRFDFQKVVRELGLDFYGCIKLINFVRSKVRLSPPLVPCPLLSFPAELALYELWSYSLLVIFVWPYEPKLVRNRVPCSGNDSLLRHEFTSMVDLECT